VKTAVFLVLLTVAPTWAETKPESRSPSIVSQQEQNKSVAARVFNEIFNQSKFRVADEIYATLSIMDCTETPASQRTRPLSTPKSRLVPTLT
jgi:hypothetical protein